MTPTDNDVQEAWQPIESCPDNVTVLFWDDGIRVGRMEHNTLRIGGQRQDHFWGGSFDDDKPPTYWMPVPTPPKEASNAS